MRPLSAKLSAKRLLPRVETKARELGRHINHALGYPAHEALGPIAARWQP
jgi:hypothetical protein